MTIKMRLDTDSLRALIKDNPEVELELTQAVLNNLKIDVLKKGIESQIEACLKGMVKNEGSSWSPCYVPADKKFTELIQKVVIEAVQAFTSEGLKNHVTQLAREAVRIETNYASKELKEVLRGLITPEMAKEIVREKVLL